MSSEDMPLLEEHPPINVTTQQLPRNYSKPFLTPSPPIAPAEALYQFERGQSPPSVWPIPVEVYRPLRRKPSSSHLSSAGTIQGGVSERPLAPFSAEKGLQNLLPPFTPSHFPSPSSPSLASTITTLQSTPSQSPAAYQADLDEELREEASQPLFTKRKFPSFTQAKRLPRRASGEWYVYAAVIEGNAEAIHQEAVKKRARSVRLAGVDSEESDASAHSASGEEKDTTTQSTFTLSNFKFPAPSGKAWADTFGHLHEPTPPTSPATLHYKGASFELVNPRASLLLGKQDIETPAEIDGLLDDYFCASEMPYNHVTGELSSPVLDTSEDGSRRTRTLFTDASSARRTIMRIPSLPADRYSPPAQDSPLAGRSTSQPVSQHDSIGTFQQQGTGPQNHFQPAPLNPSSYREDTRYRFPADTQDQVATGFDDDRNDRANISHRTSVFSDPFDLESSEETIELGRNNLDEMITTQDREDSLNTLYTIERDSELMTSEDGDEVQARLNSQNQDTTLDDFFGAYEYTNPDVGHGGLYEDRSPPYGDTGPYSASSEGFDDSAPFLDDVASPAPCRPLSHGPAGYAELNDQTGLRPRTHTHGISIEPRGPPPMTPPQAPALSPQARLPYQADCTEIPSTSQEYGPTSQLLRLTPTSQGPAQPSHFYPNGGTMIDGNGPRSETKYVTAEQRNVPPSDSAMGCADPSIPAVWSNTDLRRRGQASAPHLRVPAAVAVRLSTRFSLDDEGDWEDVSVEVRPGDIQDAHRESIISVANVSDASTVSDLIVPPMAPTRERSTLPTTIQRAATKLQRGNLKPRELLTLPGETIHDRRVHRAMQVLRTIYEEKGALPSSTSTGCSPADKELTKRLERELVALRREDETVIREAVDALTLEMNRERPATSHHKGKGRYDPNISFDHIIRKLSLDRMSLHGSEQRSRASSTRSLPGTQSSAQSGGLSYSPSQGTFITVNEGDVDTPPMPPLPANISHWSPLGSASPVIPSRGEYGTICKMRTQADQDMEMDELTITGRRLPAVSSQTGLRPMHLGNSHQDSTATIVTPDHRLTDAELMQRAPAWTMTPPVSLPGRTALDLGPRDGPRARLLDAENAGSEGLIAEQKKISRRCFALVQYCPISAFLFGIRYLDKYAENLSAGRVKEMRRNDKEWALYVAAPLGCIVYALIGVVTAMVVILTRVT
ncbi:hypothetical protein LTR78_007318 [Recurvomyces mirabilis]|uniref:Uncharacterized protein n=1 Tax=Recurvomyces mirabilis TaxID=574656 RepID=A0AAE0TSF6_9PEZI|nr:hypothetical protein LTR78_007318 [Recurvomyces mirabilis]KAK5155093.1 hypothetical protein LTS14_006048 [Recurvomyces mirabilis]